MHSIHELSEKPFNRVAVWQLVTYPWPVNVIPETAVWGTECGCVCSTDFEGILMKWPTWTFLRSHNFRFSQQCSVMTQSSTPYHHHATTSIAVLPHFLFTTGLHPLLYSMPKSMTPFPSPLISSRRWKLQVPLKCW